MCKEGPFWKAARTFHGGQLKAPCIAGCPGYFVLKGWHRRQSVNERWSRYTGVGWGPYPQCTQEAGAFPIPPASSEASPDSGLLQKHAELILLWY